MSTLLIVLSFITIAGILGENEMSASAGWEFWAIMAACGIIQIASFFSGRYNAR